MDALEQLAALKQKLRESPDAMVQMLKETFTELAPVVEDLNIEQLERGQRPDGSTLPNYSPVSVRIFGKRPGPMTMRNEGDYHRGITLVVSDTGVDLQGRDIKSEMLELRYGELLGLQEESKQLLEEGYLITELDSKNKARFA